MKKSRLMFSAAVKLLSAAAFFYGTAKTFEGLQTFTKFTYLSGAFSAAALILSLCLDFLQSRGAIFKKPQVVYILKYCSVLSSALTLIIYMSAIAPFSSKGFVGAYLGGEGASLCLHVLLPLILTLEIIPLSLLKTRANMVAKPLSRPKCFSSFYHALPLLIFVAPLLM